MRPTYTRRELHALTAVLLLVAPALGFLAARKRWGEPPPPSVQVLRLDINRAPRDALQALPGVGPKTADRIAKARPFASLADLKALLGARSLRRVEPYVVCRPRAASDSRWKPNASAPFPPGPPSPPPRRR